MKTAGASVTSAEAETHTHAHTSQHQDRCVEGEEGVGWGVHTATIWQERSDDGKQLSPPHTTPPTSSLIGESDTE